VDDLSLQESIRHVRRALESKGGDGPGTVGGTWFYRYIAACRLMPRLRLPHLADALKSKVADWCELTQEVRQLRCLARPLCSHPLTPLLQPGIL
jgi:hypothetical protein